MSKKDSGSSLTALKWLWAVTGKSKGYILLLIIVQALHGGSGVLYALCLRNIIDNAVAGDKSGFFACCGLTALLVIGQIALRSIIRWAEELSRAKFENKLKGRLFMNLLRRDFSAVTAVHSGEWLNRLTSDTMVVANSLTEILPNVAGMLVKMIGAAIMILTLEPSFVYILLPCAVILMTITYFFRKLLKSLHKGIQETDGKLRVFLQEHLASLMIVRTFSAEKRVAADADAKMEEHKNARMRRNHFSNACNIGFGLAMNGMYLIGVIWCSHGILIGTITYGTLMAVTQLISQIQTPLANITAYFPKYYAMTASAERLMEVESFVDDGGENSKSRSEIKKFYNEKFRSIGIENGCFTYQRADGEKHRMPIVLENISVEIEKGDYVAFSGHSGCGKSTLLKLLMCLYRLDSGERFICGDDERFPLDTDWLRLFAYVPQGNQLMSGTIRDIVSFADKDKSDDDERINYALKVACADEFIFTLEKGLDTELGERGQGLSEGQMQRIAIARAVFSENPVLMLDEATSALDEATERKLLANLKEMTDKTVILVTHRTAVFEICNKIINFSEKGIEVKLNEQCIK